ncbi:MAG: RDD family protein [Ilumatobacteraceae bacterium]
MEATSVQHARSDVSDGIVTPEAVVLELETAGFASRLLAGAIDLSAIFGLLFLTLIFLAIGLADSSESTVNTVLAITIFALLFGYPIVCQILMRGRTPGKAALRLRAVTADGAPIGAREAILRSMGLVVDLLLPPGGITGMLFILFTPRHQRVGDLIADTIVIRDPRQYIPAPALWFPVPYGLEDYAATIDPTPITVDQYTVVRSFLTRVNSLAPSVRYAIAADLAERLAQVTHHERNPYVAPEAFLLCAMARYQRRMGPGEAPIPA